MAKNSNNHYFNVQLMEKYFTPCGREFLFEKLITRADIIEYNIQSPLHLAVYFNRPRLLSLFIQIKQLGFRFLYPIYLRSSNTPSYSPLELAIMRMQFDMVKMLFEDMAVECYPAEEFHLSMSVPMSLAIQTNQLHLVEYFVERGFNFNINLDLMFPPLVPFVDLAFTTRIPILSRFSGKEENAYENFFHEEGIEQNINDIESSLCKIMAYDEQAIELKTHEGYIDSFLKEIPNGNYVFSNVSSYVIHLETKFQVEKFLRTLGHM